MTIVFGAMAPKLKRQLAGALPASFFDDDVPHWQADADAITRLAIRRLLPEAQVVMARNRLVRSIERATETPL